MNEECDCAEYYDRRTELLAYVICMLMSAIIGFAAGVASCS